MRRALKALAPALFTFAIYLIYTGNVSLYDLVTGALVAVVVGAALAPLAVEDWRKSLDPLRLALLVKYIFRYFLIDEVLAHWNVIKMGLSPRMNIRPGIVRVPIKSKSEYAITLVSISITNTPGTVVVDLDKDRGILYVNWIYVETTEPEGAYRAVTAVFDEYAKRIFD